MKTKIKRSTLKKFYSGVNDDPNQMGTTGLIAWVLQGLPSKHHPRNRWDRFHVAVGVIRKRNLDVSLFVDAIISTAYYYGIHLKRFYQATRSMGVTARLRPEFYQWGKQ